MALSPEIDTLVKSGTFTYTAWYKVNTDDNNWRNLVMFGADNYARAFTFFMRSVDGNEMYVFKNSATQLEPPQPQPQTWSLVAVSVQDFELTFIVVSTQGTTVVVNPENVTMETATRFILGGDLLEGGVLRFAYRGVMADMRTHNTALSQAEIEQLYADKLRV